MGSQPMCKQTRNLQEHVVIITGCNTGIGKETCLHLAKMNATIILACRNLDRTQPLLEELKSFAKTNNNAAFKFEFIKLDLSDLDSVMNFSNQFKQNYDRLDILLNNAGIMMPQQRQLSKQQYELQLATNHFGHFLLTNQLFSILKKTQNSRIINVSSLAHKEILGKQGDIHLDDMNFDKDYDPATSYCQSKLANVLFTKYLADMIKKENLQMKAVCLHPGIIKSELSRHMYEKAPCLKKLFLNIYYTFQKNTIEGAQTNIYLCLENYDLIENGAYYVDLKSTQPSAKALDKELGKKLWEYTSIELKKYTCEW